MGLASTQLACIRRFRAARAANRIERAATLHAAKERQQRRYALVRFGGASYLAARIGAEPLPVPTTQARRSWGAA
jgi:hypothetical protein